ncbi:MAG: hypothetical protein J6T82_00755 [Bacteroidaceae bacterium]|nr:hypothetical protein [Bacteroidaceae bacterium]
MKKIYYLFASLTLGLLMASCQNGLEEVINESIVQDELATTRAENVESLDDLEAVMEQTRSVDLDIEGYTIISGINQIQYEVTSDDLNVNNFYIDWDYNSSILYETDGGDGHDYIKLRLVSSTNTSDTYLRVYLRNTTTLAIEYATTIYIGCNGPRANTSSVRVVRSSDGVEVYPALVGLSPDTWYYAYFTNTQVPNMTLQWDFNHATVNINYGYTVYFKTDSTGWSFLNISGMMPGSSVYKHLLGVTLYGEINTNSITEEESNEQGEEDV